MIAWEGTVIIVVRGWNSMNLNVENVHKDEDMQRDKVNQQRTRYSWRLLLANYKSFVTG